MTSTSTQLIASVLRQPSTVDSLQWVSSEVPFRTAQDYAATQYLYRLRLCSVQVRSSVLRRTFAHNPVYQGPSGDNYAATLATSGHASLTQYPVQVTAQLTYMAEALSPLMASSAVYAASLQPLPTTTLTTTESASSPDYVVDFAFAEEWMIFSMELCDVPLDAVCELHLWYNDTHVGSAAFPVYSVEGELQVGTQHVALHAQEGIVRPALVDDTAALLAEYHRGRLPVIPWLDALATQQLEARQALKATSAAMRRDAAEGAAAALLSFFLPTATTAVFFEPAVACATADMQALTTDPFLEVEGGAGESGAAPAKNNYARCPFPDQYTFFKDYNLSEAKAAITSKSQYFVSESSAPPGPKERHQLASLLRRPPLQLEHGGGGGAGGAGGGGVSSRLDETRLLWKYRRYICRDGKFLLPFMRSVDWANTHSSERRAAIALMRQWARPTFADTLACLSFYFDHVAPVRQYAVQLLRQESDGRLCQVAFQLLQALRYDSAEGELAVFLVQRAAACWELCSTVYTMLAVEVALERRSASAAAKAAAEGSSGGGRRSPAAGAVFEHFMRRLAEQLSQHNPDFVSRLRQQHAMHRVLQQLSKQLQQSGLDRLGKTSLGNKLLAKQSCGLHALFGSVRHRAPHKTAPAAEAEAATGPSSNNNSLVMAEGASTPLETSPPASASRAAAWGDGSDGTAEVDSDAPASPQSGSAARHTTPSAPSPQQQTSHRPPTATAVNVLDRYGVVTLPTYPAVPITGILPNSLYIFKSAKLPMRLTFKALQPHTTTTSPSPASLVSAALTPPPFTNQLSGSGGGQPSSPTAPPRQFSTGPHPPVDSTHASLLVPLAMQHPTPAQRAPAAAAAGAAAVAGTSTLPQPSSNTAGVLLEDPVASAEQETVPLAMMYKYDDDVRQDQLIVQLIRVVDDLLQQDGLQLYLTPYRVVATGPSEGLVEIVPQVTTFLSVQREVLKYLRVYNPTAELLRQAMDRYTRSFAGYCVITFVLGIGDRHLENILLTQDGRLLHIDFGYVFGNDPKPFPPPMKINREMVEVLGGPQSTGFMEFKLYCCSAYNILRKHASLLLHLLLLGAHAESMPQVTGEGGDPRVNLLKVQEKLRLDLTNAQATQYLQNVIADSVGSIFTNLWDVLHAAAQATRS